MLFASGILALLCTGLAVESLLAPIDKADDEDPGPTDAPDLAGGNLLDDIGATNGAGDTPLTVEAEEQIDGYGVVSVVQDFRPGTDRLMLEFDAGQPIPQVSLDTTLEAGSTAVFGDGALMVILRGVTGVDLDDIALVRDAPHDHHALDGGSPGDLAAARAAMAAELSADGDAFTGGGAGDAITGTDAGDAIFGNDGSDILMGGAGADEIAGDDGDDLLGGGIGADFLTGGDGADSLYGGTGDDALFGQDGADHLEGDAGDDLLQGGFGADTLSGGPGNDTLDGTFSNAATFAQDTDSGDTLRGGDGDDRILVGAGDMAEGGAGADTVTTGRHVQTSLPYFKDFDPSEDVIEVLFDPAENANPVITVEDFEDGTGATVLLDGDPVLQFEGAQGLRPHDVILVPRELADA